jgi:3-phosphoshikimate 1-carboxyvinyltransferase
MNAPDTVYEVAPAGGPVTGEVRVPGSKSITNRALLLAALAGGESRLTGLLLSDDTLYMVAGLKNLGFQVRKKEAEDTVTVAGSAGKIPWNEGRVWTGNAGTAMRFLTAVLPFGRGTFVVDGESRLRKRPHAVLVDALRRLGAEVRFLGAGGREPPVEIRGRGEIRGGALEIDGEVSSQYLSALLLAGPLMNEGLDVSIRGDLASKPYVDVTLQVMRAFGVAVEREGYARFRVAHGAYTGGEIEIEGDASAATYFLAVPAVCGGRVRVRGVGPDSAQGDARFPGVLARMGAKVSSGPGWLETEGGELVGGTFEMNDMPDAALTLAAVAPFARGPVEIRNVPNLRVKETDRIGALCRALRALGAGAEELPDGLRVTPGSLRGARVRTEGDHRMAMAFAVAGLAVPGVSLEDPGCVSKTFPDFFERLEALTGKKGTLRKA